MMSVPADEIMATVKKEAKLFIETLAPMRNIEQRIISMLIEINEKHLSCSIKGKKENELAFLFHELEKEPFGKTTSAFLNNPILKEYLKCYLCVDSVKFRILIENYLTTINLTHTLKEKYFSQISKKIVDIRKIVFKANGQGLLPNCINRALIRNVYLSENAELIELFAKNLPILNIELFDGYQVPFIVQSKIEAESTDVSKFLKHNRLSAVEPMIIKLQRIWRAKIRQKEEVARIAEYPVFQGDTEHAKKVLLAVNIPYKPKGCSDELSMKILNAAQQVKLFSTVHHLTSENALKSIFNDALYGRKTLLQRYMPFDPAALASSDLQYGGDANVICFGPNRIDPTADKEDTVDIVFALDKLPANPCVFYKQCDLGYDPQTVRQVNIRNFGTLFFTHTKYLSHLGQGWSNLQVFKNYGKNRDVKNEVISSHLSNYYLISYNVRDMHQVLTLNFFRFLDNIKIIKNSIYGAIDQMSKLELIEFLTDLGKQMTDTAEFNFYGAYKIDFSAIQSIYANKSKYKVNLPTFIAELQADDKEKLNQAIKNIPTIFESYRFIDYLLSKIKHENIVRNMLVRLRQNCTIPPFLHLCARKAQEDTVFKQRPLNWMQRYNAQETWAQWKDQYNSKYPYAEKNGYGPGALQMFKSGR